MTWASSGGGLAAGCSAVHVVPSHVQVSSRRQVGHAEAARPPKRTTRVCAASYAMAACARGGGLLVGNRCVQSVPFQTHVSLTRPAVVLPPNRTTSPRAA